MARKGTAAHRSEYVTIIYGIHRATKTIGSVYIQRDGKMVGSGANGMPITNHPGGRLAESEAFIVFGLSDVFSVPVGLSSGEGTRRRLDELRTKAASEAD